VCLYEKKTVCFSVKTFYALCTFAGCIAKMNIENTAQFHKKILFVPYFYPSEFADWQFTNALNPRGG